MPDLVLQPQHISIDAGGRSWTPLVYGRQRKDGTWEGWIEFRALDDGAVRATDRETTQPNREAIEYWASGLEPVYFDGAFARSVEVPD